APAAAEVADRTHHKRTLVTTEARALQKSAIRRVCRTLLDYRDWTSYIYVPLLVPILVVAPYLSVKLYRHAQRVDQIVQSLTQSSRDLEQMSRLIQGPVPRWKAGTTVKAIPDAGTHDNTGFTVLQDLRIIDMRNWKPAAKGRAEAELYGYRRLKVLRQKENTTNNLFTIRVLAISPNTLVRFPAQLLPPTLLARSLSSPDSEKFVKWLVQADFTKIPPGESVDLVYEHESPGLFVREGNGAATLSFDVEVETVELTRWLLLREATQFREYRVIRYETGKPETAEEVKAVTRYLSSDYSVLAFKLLALKPGHTYELTWFYRCAPGVVACTAARVY